MNMFLKALDSIRAANNLPTHLRQIDDMARFQQQQSFGGQGIKPPDNTTDYQEAYATVSYVYKAINVIAIALAGLPVLIERKTGDDWIDVSDLPEFQIFKTYNEFQTHFDFWEAVLIYLLSTGESPWILKNTAGGIIEQMYPISPSFIEVVPINDFEVGYYEFIASGQKTRIEPDDMFFLKTFNPLNPVRGLSPLSAAKQDIVIDMDSVEAQQNMMKLGSRPSGVFKTDQKVDEKVWERLKKHIAEQYFGKTNTGRPMMLSHGMDWKQISLSNSEMQYLEQRQHAFDVVRQVYGVPPILMGQYKEASVLANADTQIKTFWEITVQGWTTKLDQIFTEQLLPRITSQTDVRFRFDLSEVKALQADKVKLSALLKEGFAMGGATPNDFITRILGEDPSTEAGMDSYYVPINVIPIADAGTDASDVGDEGGKAIRAMGEGIAAVEGMDGWLAKTLAATQKHDDDFRIRIDKANAFASIQQIVIRQGGPFEKKLKALFRKQEKEVLSNVSQNKGATLGGLCRDLSLEYKELDKPIWDDELETELKYSVTGVSFNMKYWIKEFKAAGQPHIAAALEMAGKNLSKELGEKYVADAFVTAFIAERSTEYATVVNKTTNQSINKLVAQGLSDGWTVAQLADKVKTYFDNNAIMRATRIARTEMVSAANASRSNVMIKSKQVNKKMWATQRDSHVRDTHHLLGGKTIKADGSQNWGDLGYNDGYSLDYPSSVNERCMEIPVRAKKEF
jgi:HK97 family phage portal protein